MAAAEAHARRLTPSVLRAAAAQVGHALLWEARTAVGGGFRRRVLRPTGERANGRGVWCTVDGGERRYLYYRVNSDQWVIASQLLPDGTAHNADIAASADGMLPEGEATWRMNKTFRGASAGEVWEAGRLALTVGGAAELEAEKEEARIQVCGQR